MQEQEINTEVPVGMIQLRIIATGEIVTVAVEYGVRMIEQRIAEPVSSTSHIVTKNAPNTTDVFALQQQVIDLYRIVNKLAADHPPIPEDELAYELILDAEGGAGYKLTPDSEHNRPRFSAHHEIDFSGDGLSAVFYLELPDGKTLDDYHGRLTFAFADLTQGAETAEVTPDGSAGFYDARYTPEDLWKYAAVKVRPIYRYTVGSVQNVVVGAAVSLEDIIVERLTDNDHRPDVDTQQKLMAVADFAYYAQPYLARVQGWRLGVDYPRFMTHYTTEYDLDWMLDKFTNADKYDISESNGGQYVQSAETSLVATNPLKLDLCFTPVEGASLTIATVNGVEQELVWVDGAAHCIVPLPYESLAVDDGQGKLTIALDDYTTVTGALPYAAKCFRQDNQYDDFLNYLTALYYLADAFVQIK